MITRFKNCLMYKEQNVQNILKHPQETRLKRWRKLKLLFFPAVKQVVKFHRDNGEFIDPVSLPSADLQSRTE